MRWEWILMMKKKEYDEVKELVESDYEIEEEHQDTTEDENPTINFDFEFGTTNRQQVRDSDTEYGDSLQSVYSEEKAETSSKKRTILDAFNARTDMEDPAFKKGKSEKTSLPFKDFGENHPYLLKYFVKTSPHFREYCENHPYL
ncbi:Uncharacterized protein Adt_46328 [Abeliophyllum distichum]|uniref:Uncharacterized protein n=1 Tax=Abeliophyllum distichum TaxID=126358 RepID=A0ABD1P440_9LAMI